MQTDRKCQRSLGAECPGSVRIQVRSFQRNLAGQLSALQKEKWRAPREAGDLR